MRCVILAEANLVQSGASAVFVACIEDALDEHEEPTAPDRPLVCFGEAINLLTEAKRLGLPPRSCQVQ